MRPVLVLVERRSVDATVRRTTCASADHRAAARDPGGGAVRPGRPGQLALLGRFGATIVYTVTAREATSYPAAARVETLVAARPPALAVRHSDRLGRAGQEIAARVAVRLDSGSISDAIDVRTAPDGSPVAVQSVLADSYRVESSVVRGIPVFTVRADVRRAPGGAGRAGGPHASGDRSRRVYGRSGGSRAREGPLTRGRTWPPPPWSSPVAAASARGTRSSLVDQVAEALGGAVGGSHAATRAGLVPARGTGRPGRQDRAPRPLPRPRDLRLGASPRRHAGRRDHRGHRPRPGGAHLRQSPISAVVGDLHRGGAGAARGDQATKGSPRHRYPKSSGALMTVRLVLGLAITPGGVRAGRSAGVHALPAGPCRAAGGAGPHQRRGNPRAGRWRPRSSGSASC